MYTRQVQGVSERSRSITAGVRDYSRAFVISVGHGMNIQSAMLKAIKKIMIQLIQT